MNTRLVKTGFILFIAGMCTLMGISGVLSQSAADIPPGKRTVLDLYLTAEEAWAMVQDDPQKVHILTLEG